LKVLGLKKPGIPPVMARKALDWLRKARVASMANNPSQRLDVETVSQKSLSRSIRRPGGLPAMIAALAAPMETPASQSGSIPASVKPSKTPA
jgi:hypothetical protein